MSGYRLATGGRIDRSRTVRFSWGGQPYEGHPGDTLPPEFATTDMLSI